MAEKVLNPFQFVVIVLAGWMNQRQQNVIEYLREENRVLREQLGERRLRFTDDQRRRLAVRARPAPSFQDQPHTCCRPAHVPHLPPHHALVPQVRPLARPAASGPALLK